MQVVVSVVGLVKPDFSFNVRKTKLNKIPTEKEKKRKKEKEG